MTNPSLKSSDATSAEETITHGANPSELEPTLTPERDAAVSTVLLDGSTLGPYQILQKLGEGGMGAVYKARHSKLDKTVAIKVLSAAVTHQPSAVARFEREMKAVGKLNHPNIVQAHDAGEVNGTHYLAMEYVDGTDLAKLVKDRGPMSVVNACKAIRQTALALASAHQAGLVHRDIKPSNLLVAKNGQIKLLDLGLARLAGEAATNTTDLTTSGQTFGTPDYMAPEQWEDAHSADSRTDLYALGCTLFFLLTGRTPFGSDTHRTAANKMKGHLIDPVPDLQTAREDTPEDVVAIYRKLMAKKPADRFQTAAELAEALIPFSSNKSTAGTAPTEALPATAARINERTPPPSVPQAVSQGGRGGGPRRFYQIAGGAAAFVVLLSVIVITITSKDGKKTTVKVPEGTPVEVDAPPGSKVSITQSPESDTTAISSTGWHGWPAEAPKPAIAPFDATQAKMHQDEWAAYLKVPVQYTNSIGMKFRLIPPGEFTMGSTPEEIAASLKDVPPGDKHFQECIKSESPQHKVILTQPIYLGVNEVTQAEYESIMGVNPSHFSSMGEGKEAVTGLDTAKHPVEWVKWNDAADFCAKLSQGENLKPLYVWAGDTINSVNGAGYRLPTEAEWEFACRAGTATKYWIGDQDRDLLQAAWFGRNSGRRTHAVGELIANPFGLYDIHGNVCEWVQDGWDPNYYGHIQEQPASDPSSPFLAGSERVFRGGFWVVTASLCGSSTRHSVAPSNRYNNLGFRVSLPVDAVQQAISASIATKASSNTSEAAVDDATNFAIRLAPGGHVEMPSLKLDPVATYTIEAWVTPRGANHIDKHVAGWTGPFSLFVSSQELNWSFGLARNGGPYQFLLSPNPAVIDRRIHLAAVRTGKEFRLFVDGQRVGNSREHSSPLADPRAPFSLSSPRHPFSGDFDEVRISRVARYDENFTPKIRLEPDDDTLALYHCDENGGDNLVDSSSQKHHGKIIGSAMWVGFGKAVASADVPKPAIAPFDAVAAQAHQEAWAKHLGVPVESTNSIGAKMILIPPGEFLMGAPDADTDALPPEKPQHRVTLTKPIAMGATEVTNREFLQFVEATKYITQAESDGQGDFEVNPKVRRPSNTWNNPEFRLKSGDDHPVRCVSWEDARRFCDWLTQTEGRVYRLPTEAEWEFACRAGTATRYSFGDNLSDSPSPPGTSGAPLRAVAQLPANPFGLFDMHGSVNEFCLDSGRTFTADAVTDPIGSLEIDFPAVVRGGAVSSSAARQRSSNRYLSDARRFPETNFATTMLGFRVVREMAPTPPLARAPFDAQHARTLQEAWAAHLKLPVVYTNSTGMKFCLIPPGEFLMGSTDEQVAAAHRLATEAKAMSVGLERIQLAERPQHRVVISMPFQFGSTEVTNADFRKFVEATQYVTQAEQFGFGDDGAIQLSDKVTEEQKKLTWRAPGYPITEDLPVTQVSWNDAVAYCRWLSTLEQTAYRLPTEAEWEYACRAGTTTHYSFGDEEETLEQSGWYGRNANGRPEAVGSKLANGFGLHDMHGNLFEWCHDIFDEAWYQRSQLIDPVGPTSGPENGTYYVVRGGFWGANAPLCRSAFRINHTAAYRHRSGGFRVVREIAPAR